MYTYMDVLSEINLIIIIIISTDARNTSARRVGHDRTGIQHVNNSELRENATYESILYFTHHKTLKCNLEL